MPTNKWTSRFAYIVTLSGFAVGLGNIWRFSYITGSNGGGAFLFIYLILAILIGIPLLITEASLGRMAGVSPLRGFGEVSGKKSWNVVGWLGILTNTLIMGYYVVIIAWVTVYFWECASGNLFTIPVSEYSERFDTLCGSFPVIFGTTIGIILFTGWIVSRGLNNGLERLSKLLMPLLLVLIIGLGIWGVSIEGASEGIRWYLDVDFSKISLEAVLAGVGQLFFSIGIGFSTAYVFGSYMSKEEDLVYSTGTVVLVDTLVAVLAGFMIFPALFAYNIPPDSGPNLVFVTMSSLFSELPFGQLFGALFFFLLFVAGITSLISNIEAITFSFQDQFRLTRQRAMVLTLLIILGLSVPSILSFTKSNPLTINGRTFYDIMDYVTNSIFLPLGGLLLVVFGVYIIGFRNLQEATNTGAKTFRMANYWAILLKVIIPLIIITILIQGILG